MIPKEEEGGADEEEDIGAMSVHPECEIYRYLVTSDTSLPASVIIKLEGTLTES